MKNGRMQSVDFDKISQWTPVHEEVMYSSENSQEVLQAQKDELDKWKEYEVYEEVEDAITTKWVVTEKKQDGVSRVKAWLVEQGFEEDTTKIRTDSPTISKENLHLTHTTAVNNGWKLHSIDIKAAFSKGFPIDRDVYLVPPVEANTGKLWKLKTAVYGLVDASRAWYLTGSFSRKGNIFGWEKNFSDFKLLTLELLKIHHQSLKLKFLKYAAQVTTDFEPIFCIKFMSKNQCNIRYGGAKIFNQQIEI